MQTPILVEKKNQQPSASTVLHEKIDRASRNNRNWLINANTLRQGVLVLGQSFLEAINEHSRADETNKKTPTA